jgi:ComF family protein
MPRVFHKLLGSVRRLAGPGLTLLYPTRCVCCDMELPEMPDALPLCRQCQTDLGPETWTGCPRCGVAGEKAVSGKGCKQCRKTTLKTDSTVPLGVYKDHLRAAVLRMKRPNCDSLSAGVGKLFAHRRNAELRALNADFLVPVPMHWSRRLRRGTNSPEIVARSVAVHLRIPVRGRMLVRSRNTLPQQDLTPAQRLSNVRGAFRIRPTSRLEGARVLLVDDILTTGATCSEAARMLKRAGAAMVAAVVVARTKGTTSR